MRVGGFGGVDGLAAYLRRERISHVIDATHPFASQMSENAIAACAAANVRLAALVRPAWAAQAGDSWTLEQPAPEGAPTIAEVWQAKRGG